MEMVGTSESDSVAAYDAESERLVIVAASYGAARTMVHDLRKLTSAKGGVTRFVTETSGTVRYEERSDVALEGGTLTVDFAANTIQTFVIEGVVL